MICRITDLYYQSVVLKWLILFLLLLPSFIVQHYVTLHYLVWVAYICFATYITWPYLIIRCQFLSHFIHFVLCLTLYGCLQPHLALQICPVHSSIRVLIDLSFLLTATPCRQPYTNWLAKTLTSMFHAIAMIPTCIFMQLCHKV